MTANGFSSYERFVKMGVVLLYFTICLTTVHENQLLHFQPSKYCLQRILCSDFRSKLLFLFYENKHFLKKLVPYVAPGRATRTKMTANGFSSYELFVKIDVFYLFLQYVWSLFMKTNFFICIHLNIVCRGFCVPTSEASCSSYFMKTNIV